MRMIVKYDGETYESSDDADVTAEEASEALYASFERANKLRLNLKDGGKLIIGKDAVQRAVLIFKP